jgi:hypothetical protein
MSRSWLADFSYQFFLSRIHLEKYTAYFKMGAKRRVEQQFEDKLPKQRLLLDFGSDTRLIFMH